MVVILMRKYAVVAGIVAIFLSLSGCSTEHHTTEVQLPNGVTCTSETTGTFFQTNRNISCIDSTGKVIGSYKND